MLRVARRAAGAEAAGLGGDAVKAAEVAREVARVVAADERHHLLDGEERALEQQARPQHAQGVEIARRRGADLALEQVSEPRRREMDLVGERIDGERGAEALFHGGDGR